MCVVSTSNLANLVDPLRLFTKNDVPQTAPTAPTAPPTPAGQTAKAPDVAAMRNQNAGASAASTLLTGPTGVDPNQLTLGKNALLGM